jgi:16S rRNA (cytosine967-C5)-methyltransferase
MGAMSLDVVLDVLASTLYIVKTRRVSVRRAFTEACRRRKCVAEGFTREDLYQLARSFVSSYYKVRYISSASGRASLSNRLLARLFLYLHLSERGVKPPPKLKKAVLRDLPGLSSSIEALPVHAKYSLPPWLCEKLTGLLGPDSAEALMAALNERVLWLRVNTLKVDLDKAVRELERSGFRVEVDADVPYLLRVVQSPRPIRTHRLFKEGAIIPQDKASVLVVEALRPEPGSLVYDFAAAPGVKTSLIMQLCENRARIVAIDYSPRRLEVMKSLLAFYGVDTSRVTFTLADSRLVKLREMAEYGLLDAPCSSSGAIPKDPAIKILLEDESVVHRFSALQAELLKNALRYTEVLVYATCSLLPEEGEEVVLKALEEVSSHELREPKISASHGYPRYPIWSRVKRTFPHIHRSEGFFIARLEKAL